MDEIFGPDNYLQLMAFVWSADLGSFSAAARAQNMSPSAVSKLITRLEKRLGVRLFVRLSRSIALTDEGRAFYGSARAVADAMADARAAGENLFERVSGVLRVHTMLSFAKYQIVPWLADFVDQYPTLKVELQLGPRFVDLFDQGVDLAVHSGTMPDSSRIARKIATSRWIVCAAPSYLEKHGTPSSIEELSRHRCMNFGFATEWNSWSFDRGSSAVVHAVNPHVSTTQGDLLREMALAGGGIVKLAEFHVGADLLAGRLVEILLPFSDQHREPIYLMYANRKHLSPRIAAFATFMERWLREQTWANSR